jgi:hypothetical protein
MMKLFEARNAAKPQTRQSPELHQPEGFLTGLSPLSLTEHLNYKRTVLGMQTFVCE